LEAEAPAEWLKKVSVSANRELLTVQDDLQGLEISHIELRKLTNLPVNDDLILIGKKFKKIFHKFIDKIQGSEAASVLFVSVATVVFSYVFFDVILKLFIPGLNIPSWILFILLLIGCSSITQISFYLIWQQHRKTVNSQMNPSLKVLLVDVERYNNVIKAILINDQIEAAGNPEVTIQDRHKVIEALQLTRSDLVRALKTERVLRENKKFILKNTELFDRNLPALSTIQMDERATEHGKLLNEALQIAMNVQLEMQRLQSQE
jgi:hypothetical protein